MQQGRLDIHQIKQDFRGEVAIFPQPSLVLLPDGFAPLRIFEERYVELLRDAAEEDKLVGMALLQPGWESEYAGTPAIFPTLCIGRILKFSSTSTDKCEALVFGVFRARVRREIADFPYRRAEVEILDDPPSRAESEDIARRVRRTLELVPGRKTMIANLRRMATQLRGLDATAGRYADAVADASGLSPEERYAILAQPNVKQRLDRLIEVLELRAYAGTPTIPAGTRPELN